MPTLSLLSTLAKGDNTSFEYVWIHLLKDDLWQIQLKCLLKGSEEDGPIYKQTEDTL